ncbi:MAG TPA: hypothetical protein DEP51_03715 [Clostridiales bacterium]|nr:hypothetical protein [Clostridiales bacterium]
MATTPKGIYYPNNYNEIADIPEDMKKMAESIEEVFEDTDSDLSDIKEEQTTQNNRLNSLEVDNTTNKSDILTNKQEINNIKTEQTEQNTNISTNATNIESLQEENENLKKIVSQLPQVTGQGTSITLENTIEAQFTKFDEEGNSTQETTEGKNKFHIASVTPVDGNTIYNKITNNEIEVSTKNPAGYRYVSIPVEVEANTTYYFKANIKNSNSSVSNSWLGVLNSDNTNTLYNNSYSDGAIKSFNTGDNTIVNINLYATSNVAAINTTTWSKIQLTTNNNDSFEPYTGGIASPNPNYEQPIESAGDNENLFDIGTSIDDYDVSGSILAQGGTFNVTNNKVEMTIIGGGMSYAIRKQKLAPNETYSISGKASMVYSRIGVKLRSKDDTRWLDNNDTSIEGFTYNSIYKCWFKENNLTNFELNVTIPDCLYWNLFIGFNSLQSQLGIVHSISDIKIEKGNKATPYSPYGMGSINEKISNKNVWNIDKFKNLYGTNTYETYNNVECLKLAGSRQVYDFKGEENTQYTFQFKLIGSTLNDEIGAFSLVYSDGTSDYKGGILTPKTYIFTSKANKTLVRIIWSGWSAGHFIYIDKNSMQLEPGSTASPYVEHKEQDYSIFVQQPFRSIGDVRDCFVKKSDGWYERHWIKEFIVSQNTGINLQSINDYGIANFYMVFQNNYYDLTSKDNQLCNLFSKQTSSIATTETEGFLPTMNLAAGLIGVYIRILSSRAKTVEEFKQWANTNNLKNYYILAEPLDLPCTETQTQQLENLPSTYKDFTIINSEDETEAYLEVSGIYDLNKLITRTEVLESEV